MSETMVTLTAKEYEDLKSRKVVSITTSEMDKEPFDSTPEELLAFRKKPKPDLELIAFTQLTTIRELQTSVSKLKAQVTTLEFEKAQLTGKGSGGGKKLD